MLRQIINKTRGLTRCNLRQTARLMATEFSADVDSHSDPETEPLKMRERLNENFKNPETDTWESRAIWFKILAASQQTLRAAERLEKGDRVYIQGKILRPMQTDSQYIPQTTVLSETLFRVSRPRRNMEGSQRDEEVD